MKDEFFFKWVNPINFSDLLNKADILAGNDDDVVKECYSEIWNTKLLTWLCFLSEFANEIAVPVKQHCFSREYIIKHMQNYNVILLVKPTKPESHFLHTYSRKERH